MTQIRKADQAHGQLATGFRRLGKLPAGKQKVLATSLAALVAGGIFAACGSSSSSSNAESVRNGIATTNSQEAAGMMSSSGQAQQQSPSTTAAAASNTSDQSATSSGEAQSGLASVVPIVLQRDDKDGTPGTITGKPDWPRFAPSTITLQAGKEVTLLITNYDDMNTPLAPSVPYNAVQGGKETVNGVSVASVGNKTIAHTFTVPQLGINVPIPMATDSGKGSSATVIPAIVTFTFTPAKTGSFTWQCYTPCGTDPNGMNGPMVTLGDMKGTLTVA